MVAVWSLVKARRRLWAARRRLRAAKRHLEEVRRYRDEVELDTMRLRVDLAEQCEDRAIALARTRLGGKHIGG